LTDGHRSANVAAMTLGYEYRSADQREADAYPLKSTIKIGCLSTANDPALGHWVRALQRNSYTNLTVILDSKQLSDGDLARWDERTGGRLPAIPYDAPTIEVSNHNDAAGMAQGFDVLLNCGTPRILKSGILNASKHGAICVHPGKLPDYRGCSVVEWALFNGDPVCNTAYLMQEAIDDGPIILVKPVGIQPGDSYTDIRVKTYLAGFDLMPHAVSILVSGATLQTPESKGRYWKPIDNASLSLVMAR
jgi:hypothetical protein